MEKDMEMEMKEIIKEYTALKENSALMEKQLSEMVAAMNKEFTRVKEELQEKHETLRHIDQENQYAVERTDHTGWSPCGESWKIQRNLERLRKLVEKSTNSARELSYSSKKIEEYTTWLEDASRASQLADLVQLLNTGDALRNARAQEQEIALQKANHQVEMANPRLFIIGDLREEVAETNAFNEDLIDEVIILRKEIAELRKKLGVQ